MYYELINEVWQPNNKKSALFNGDTIPTVKPEELPTEFWNADRMPAAPVPVYDSATHKLVGPQVIGETVGYVVEPLTPVEIAERLDVAQSINRVNRYQIRMGLKEIGQLSNVKAVYSALPIDHDIIILWSNSVDFPRNGQLAADLISRFNLTDAQLDNLWQKSAAYTS